jgi:hypothetical protein
MTRPCVQGLTNPPQMDHSRVVVALVAGAMSVVMTVLRSAGFLSGLRGQPRGGGVERRPSEVDGGWIAPSKQSEIPRPGDGLGAARRAELDEDVVDVALDGAGRNEERAGYPGVGEAVRDQPEHLQRAVAQGLDERRSGGRRWPRRIGIPCRTLVNGVQDLSVSRQMGDCRRLSGGPRWMGLSGQANCREAGAADLGTVGNLRTRRAADGALPCDFYS